MSISRRDFMTLLGGSVVGAAAVAAGGRLNPSRPAAGVSQARLDAWKVAEIGQVQHGAVPITVANGSTGERITFEVCRKGSVRAPVATSSHYDLYVANGGTGNTPSRREHVLVGRALSQRLDHAVGAAPVGLLTMDERLASHPELFNTSDDFANA